MLTPQDLENNRLAFNQKLVDIQAGIDNQPTTEERDENERRKLEERLNGFAIYSALECAS